MGCRTYMTRKDSEKDSERPHYYSQFWLDVAAGRRVIGAPKGDEAELAEPEIAEAVMPSRRATPVRPDTDYSDRYNGANVEDGHHEVIAHPIVDPVISQDDIVEPAELDIINDEAEDLDIQDTAIVDSDPDMDLEPLEEDGEETEEEDPYEEEDEEEEDEDTGWNRGRKKPSPKRPTKQPTKKPGKRDTRRTY